MLFIPIALVVVGGVIVYRMLAQRRHPASAVAGQGAPGIQRDTQVMPASREGTWSLWVSLAAIVLAAVPTFPRVFTSLPLAVIAVALALVAMIRRHDRAALLWLPVVFGLGILITFTAFWIAG